MQVPAAVRLPPLGHGASTPGPCSRGDASILQDLRQEYREKYQTEL